MKKQQDDCEDTGSNGRSRMPSAGKRDVCTEMVHVTENKDPLYREIECQCCEDQCNEEQNCGLNLEVLINEAESDILRNGPPSMMRPRPEPPQPAPLFQQCFATLKTFASLCNSTDQRLPTFP